MPKLDGMTLRERVAASLRLDRELIEHLDQGFVPKIHNLRRLTRPDARPDDPDEEGPRDRTVHSLAAGILESDQFTIGVYQQLVAHCESVRSSVREMADS